MTSVTLDPIMKLIHSIILSVPIMFICMLGILSALVGLHRLDAWCEKQLTDS